MKAHAKLVANLVDWVPAGLLAVFGELDITFNGRLGSVFPGPAIAHRLFVLAASLPIGLRRRYPLAIQAFVTIAAGSWVALLFPPRQQPPLEAFLVALLVDYSAAVHAKGWRVWVAGAVAALWIPGTIATSLIVGENPADALASWILVGGAFGLGLVIRRQRSLTRRLSEYAHELEHEREERAVLAAALERSRIARELHDVIAHSLTMIVVQAAAERRVLGEPGSSTGEVLRTIEDAGRQAMAEMRRLLGVLRRTGEPPQEVPQPRLQDLDMLVEQVRGAGLNVDLQVEGDRYALSPGVDLTAYRIIQESLSNVLKHAGGVRANVLIRYRPRSLELEVNDDGRAPAGNASGGHGLVGMRERVSLYGGSLEVGPNPEGGFRVRAVLPAIEASR